MKEIQTEIEINASGEKVWQVLTNFAVYPPMANMLVRIRNRMGGIS